MRWVVSGFEGAPEYLRADLCSTDALQIAPGGVGGSCWLVDLSSRTFSLPSKNLHSLNIYSKLELNFHSGEEGSVQRCFWLARIRATRASFLVEPAPICKLASLGRERNTGFSLWVCCLLEVLLAQALPPLHHMASCGLMT